MSSPASIEEQVYRVAAGTAGFIAQLFVFEAASDAGITALTDSSFSCHRHSPSTGSSEVLLVGSSLGVYSSGGIVEIDASNLPGYYEFGVPGDDLLVGGQSVIYLFASSERGARLRIEVDDMNLTCGNPEPTSGLSGGDPVTFSTANSDVSGQTGPLTTVVTGAANGSLIRGIQFCAVSPGPDTGTVIYIFHSTGGTVRRIGHVIVPPHKLVNETNPPWSAIWTHPDAQYILQSGDLLRVSVYSGTATYHALALGGDY